MANSYRQLVLVENPSTETERCWNSVCSNSASYWERLSIRDQAIYLKCDGQPDLLLTSIKADDLPPLSAEASALGRWMARHSLFARILSSRVGKEEVTFYALANEAHGQGFDARFDRIMLNIGHAPLCYRRQKVVETIRRALLECVRRPDARLAFLDIGSGGGFDGLDVHRICSALPGVRHQIINIDIDDIWLANNERLAKAVGATTITRRHVSIFDYLKARSYETDLQGVTDLIVCCNGFADFFPDDAIRELLQGVRRIASRVPGKTRFVFAAALERSRLQTSLSKLIGFNYTGRASAVIREIVASALPDYQLRFEERHSQIVCIASKN